MILAGSPVSRGARVPGDRPVCRESLLFRRLKVYTDRGVGMGQMAKVLNVILIVISVGGIAALSFYKLVLFYRY